MITSVLLNGVLLVIDSVAQLRDDLVSQLDLHVVLGDNLVLLRRCFNRTCYAPTIHQDALFNLAKRFFKALWW